MLNVSDLQRYLPPRMKFYLKRYYRTFFPINSLSSLTRRPGVTTGVPIAR
jgi:hypothetical protein